MPVSRVAIVGRPNVGKSSLLNWLAGRRISIVDPTAGVTRDRIATLIVHEDRYFELIDTGGIGVEDVDNLTEDVERQIQLAIDSADVLLYVVDVRAGVMPLDEEVNRRLRYVTKPIIAVANKADTLEWEAHAADLYRLGRGKFICVSAEQKRGRDELLAAILKHLPEDNESQPPTDADIKLAIVGRRNTGKSTFINSLAESERVIVSEVAGTTRDSVDVRIERDGKSVIAIDTAGVRRKRSVSSDIEFYSLARAERSIRRADVVLMFFDPRVRVSKVDMTLIDYVIEASKPTIFVVNKWDLMKASMPTEKFSDYLQQRFSMLDYVPIAFITAKSGKNVQALLNLAQNLHKQASQRVGTGELNQVLQEAITAQAPPMRQNRRAKVYYATQVATNPPTIVVFTNGPHLFDNTYQRYLLKHFRDRLPFKEVPIQLFLRMRSRVEGGTAEDDTDIDATALGKPPREKKKKPVDNSGLKFKTELDDDEIHKESKQFDSEIWRDL